MPPDYDDLRTRQLPSEQNARRPSLLQGIRALGSSDRFFIFIGRALATVRFPGSLGKPACAMVLRAFVFGLSLVGFLPEGQCDNEAT
jgi:hypothetical protein